MKTTIQAIKSDTPLREMTTVIPDGYDGVLTPRNLKIIRYAEDLVTTKSTGLAMRYHIEKISGFSRLTE